MMVYKLYAIMLLPAVKNMNGNRGRMAVQAAHGFLHSYWDSVNRFPEDALAYQNQGSAFKICLAVDSEEVLETLKNKYEPICGVRLVLERGTKADGSVNEAVKGITCLGLGPIDESRVGDDLRALRSFL